MALNQVDEEEPDIEPDIRTQERVARNDALFREANEGIEDAATKYEVLDQVPFICECANENCRKLLVLSVAEYEEIRQHPRHFLHAPGHVRADEGAGQVVTDRGRYTIVEKTGHAGEVVEQLDPRGGGN